MTRNPEATCANCIHRWSGKENFMVGFDTIIRADANRCSRDGMRPVNLDHFCRDHPEFESKGNTGFSTEGI